MAYIEFKNVKKIYKMGDVKIRALNGVDFKIDKGEFAVVLGPSGAGKSTILKLLLGLYEPEKVLFLTFLEEWIHVLPGK